MKREEGTPRLGWARLNADALFVALLVVAAGSVTFLWPEVQEGPRLALYAAAGEYICGGLLLLFALVRSSIRWEVLGRAIIMTGPVTLAWRDGFYFGWGHQYTIGQYILLAIMGITFGLRLSALVRPHDGMIVHIPGKTKDVN